MNHQIITEYFDRVLKLINYINYQIAEIEKNLELIDNHMNFKFSQNFNESLRLLNDRNLLLRKKLAQLAHLLTLDDEELMKQLDDIYLQQKNDLSS